MFKSPHYLYCCLLGITAASVSAHDPYEITSTVSLLANRIDLHMEMEFPTAMLLVSSNSDSTIPLLPIDQFELYLPQLEKQAGRFIQIDAAGVPLRALETNVALEVENHVFFHLVFPPTESRPFQFSAPGLQTLSRRGPFGTTLTVLDMVHQKVLGQEVLFADSPAIELDCEPMALSVPTSTVAKTNPQIATTPAAVPQPAPSAAPAPHSRNKGLGLILWMGLLAFMVVGIIWSCGRPRPG